MKRIIQSLSVAALTLLVVFDIVHAGTAITYNGSGIRGKKSVQQWTTSSRKRHTVYHNQRPNPGSGGVGFKVSVVSRSWWAGGEYASSIFYGQTSGSFSVDLNAGTYGLYFGTTSPGSYDIWGSVEN